MTFGSLSPVGSPSGRPSSRTQSNSPAHTPTGAGPPPERRRRRADRWRREHRAHRFIILRRVLRRFFLTSVRDGPREDEPASVVVAEVPRVKAGAAICSGVRLFGRARNHLRRHAEPAAWTSRVRWPPPRRKRRPRSRGFPTRRRRESPKAEATTRTTRTTRLRRMRRSAPRDARQGVRTRHLWDITRGFWCHRASRGPRGARATWVSRRRRAGRSVRPTRCARTALRTDDEMDS